MSADPQSKATAGPWHIRVGNEGLSSNHLEIFARPPNREVASIINEDTDIDELDWANARLIAAAPDLCDALNRMLASFADDLCIECGEVSGTCAGCDTCYVIGEAIKAVRKARGESVEGKKENEG